MSREQCLPSCSEAEPSILEWMLLLLSVFVPLSPLSLKPDCCDSRAPPAHRERMTLRQARPMTLLLWKSNQSAQISTYRLDISFHFNVGLSNVCIASVMPRFLCSNDSKSSAVNIHCSATLTGIICFSLARTAHSRIMNARSSCSTASCTLRITKRGSMESISNKC